jgi:hypothetical protein
LVSIDDVGGHDRLPELRGLQATVLQSQVQQNVPCLNAEVDTMSPAAGDPVPGGRV